MRRALVLTAALLAFVVSGLALALNAGSSSHAAKVGGPNFVCVAAWNYGVCVGPPTTSG